MKIETDIETSDYELGLNHNWWKWGCNKRSIKALRKITLMFDCDYKLWIRTDMPNKYNGRVSVTEFNDFKSAVKQCWKWDLI